MRDSFIFYKSFYESIKELEPLDQVQIYNAIFEYEFNKNEIKLNGISKSIFTLIKPQLIANDKKYENGKKGGRPKNQTITKNKPNNNQIKTKNKPNSNLMNNVNDNENVNDNVNINNNMQKTIYYENDELDKIFKEFLQIRKKLKAVNSDRAIKTLINKLSKYDDSTKYKMIEQSIIKSWKDIYELKEEKNKIEAPHWLNKDYSEKKERNLTEEDYEWIRNFKESNK